MREFSRRGVPESRNGYSYILRLNRCPGEHQEFRAKPSIGRYRTEAKKPGNANTEGTQAGRSLGGDPQEWQPPFHLGAAPVCRGEADLPRKGGLGKTMEEL